MGKWSAWCVLWAYSWLCFITMGKTSVSEEGKSTLIATSIQRMVLKTIVAASCRKQSSPNLPTKILVINVMCDWLIYLHMSKKPENAQELDACDPSWEYQLIPPLVSSVASIRRSMLMHHVVKTNWHPHFWLDLENKTTVSHEVYSMNFLQKLYSSTQDGDLWKLFRPMSKLLHSM